MIVKEGIEAATKNKFADTILEFPVGNITENLRILQFRG